MAEATETKNYCVVFADVAGSTALYERVGDERAEEQISNLIDDMIATVKKNNGVLIKTIGDEIMCQFSEAKKALLAAAEIQLDVQAMAMQDASALRVRIGLQYGPAILKQGDLFGDTVNVAARMAGLALENQIITTLDCMLAGKDSSVDYRLIDTLYVKGREKPVQVCEVLWRADDHELTTLAGTPVGLEKNRLPGSTSLMVEAGGHSYCLNEKRLELLVGRGAQCDIVIPSTAASRAHVKLMLCRGKILLVDQSTNGTYVRLDTGEAFFVHKEELPLTQTGKISLGMPFSDFSESDEQGVEDASQNGLADGVSVDTFQLSFVCRY